jgi:hypothetical protein
MYIEKCSGSELETSVLCLSGRPLNLARMGAKWGPHWILSRFAAPCCTTANVWGVMFDFRRLVLAPPSFAAAGDGEQRSSLFNCRVMFWRTQAVGRSSK